MKLFGKAEKVAAFAVALVLFIGTALPVGGFDASQGDEINVELSAEAIYSFDCATGDVIISKNADKVMRIASLTKLMTALVALEAREPDETIEITQEHINIEGSKMYLMPGEKRSLRELLYGLLLASGNDAARAVAELSAGSEEAFVAMMNEKAESLGLRDTHFENSCGLDGESHRSTAREFALIAKTAFDNPLIREITGTKYYTYDNKALKNHNKLLWNNEYCIGGKTGFTKSAGRCLVTLCESQGREIITVTLNAPSDWSDHTLIADKYFGEISTEVYYCEAEHDLAGGTKESVTLVAQASVPLRPGERERVETELICPFFSFAPVEKGESAGKACFYLGGLKIGEAELYFKDGAEYSEPEKGFFERLKDFISEAFDK